MPQIRNAEACASTHAQFRWLSTTAQKINFLCFLSQILQVVENGKNVQLWPVVELTLNTSCETQAADLKLCFSDSALDLTSIDGK
ncbi:MAG: hypothetical protein GY820_42335, partial [Gammaproteobacteria bacterium]|nr:hypothetical protein [Gammaproteobacteria bacterium]